MKKFTYLICLLSIHFTGFAQELVGYKNIVIILADDHASKAIGAYGNPLVKTPNIDQLYQEGIAFTNAYGNSSISSASRQSLLTGKYPHATGVNCSFTPFPDEGNITIAEHLSKKNYQTVLIGRSYFNNWIWQDLYPAELPHHGFQKIIEHKDYQDHLKENPPLSVPEHKNYYFEDVEKSNVGDWMNAKAFSHPVYDQDSEGTFYANQAIQFLQENKEKPFLLWLAFNEPHHPFYFPIEFAGKHQAEQITLLEGSPEDDPWTPEEFKSLTDDEKKGIITAYYNSVSYMDKNIGLVINALKDLELDKNTIVVYLSDNGYLLYDHKCFEPHTFWEETVHQPMIFWFGSDFTKPREEKVFVEYIDVVPTLLDLLDVKPIKEAQGESFVATLQGKESFMHRFNVFAENLEDKMVMVRSGNWKYIFSTGRRNLGLDYQTGNNLPGVTHQLYDLHLDSTETKNLAYFGSYYRVLNSLKNHMLHIFMETHPDANKCPQNLSIDGKLVWFCEPRDVGTGQPLKD